MSTLDRRRFLGLLATAGAVTAVPGCAGAAGGSSRASTDEPIRIGLVAPRAGEPGGAGTELRNGFRLYLARTGGRLGGRHADIVHADEGATAASGLAAVESLLGYDNLVAIAGVVSSTVMAAVRDRVERAEVPLVACPAGPSALRDARYVWRTAWADTDPARALGGHVARTLPGPVTTVAPDSPAGRELAEYFRRALVAAGGHLGEQRWVSTPASLDQALTAIRGSAARAVFAGFDGAAGLAFVRRYRQLGVGAPLFAPGTVTEAAGPPSAEAAGLYTAMNYTALLDNPANHRFTAEYRTAHGTVPTAYAVGAFDAAHVLDRAVAAAGRFVTRESVNVALGQLGPVDSPRGGWRFDAERAPVQRWYLRQVRTDGDVLANVVVAELNTADG